MSDVEGETSGNADAAILVAGALTRHYSTDWLQSQRI